MDKIEIICLESEAFYRLLESVLLRIQSQEKKADDKWVSGTEAMRMMRIKSKATLQKMRDEGRIRFTQPERKIILYDADSIRDYLDDFVYEPFKMDTKKSFKN